MRSTEERLAQLHIRADRLARVRRTKRFAFTCAGAGLSCAVFLAALIFAVYSAEPASADLTVSPALTASILVRGGALGCVLISIAAFSLGVVFTVFCYRLKRRMTEKDRKDD